MTVLLAIYFKFCLISLQNLPFSYINSATEGLPKCLVSLEHRVVNIHSIK